MNLLQAQSPLTDLTPLRIGNVTVQEVVFESAWLVAPFKGQVDGVAKLLGLAWPAPGQVVVKDGRRALWVAGGQAVIIGGEMPALSGLAAVSDQADAFAIAQVSGPDTEAVLARLVPVDLRLRHFPVNATARTLVGHMTASVTRVADDRFELMVMRSMAGTLIHDLRRAMTGVAGRG